MSSSRFFIGVGLLLLALMPLALAATTIRSRFFPPVDSVTARIAEAVLVLAAFTTIAEALGVVGQFRRWPLVVACACIGGVAYFAVRSRPASRSASPADGDLRNQSSSWEVAIASFAVAVVGAQWLSVSLAALREGMNRGVDTLWYHGPISARFVQEASVAHPHYFDNPVFAFYAMHSEVWHAGGILFFGDDVLSPLINLVFLAIAFAAAWSIGAWFGAAAPALLGAAVVIGTPGFIGQPGSAYNDIVCVALFLAAIALLVHGRGHDVALALAAMAAGITIGVKLSMLGPVAALALAVVVLAGRGRRLRVVAIWSVGIVVMGGIWYVRNFAVAGSPQPGVDISIGPYSFPSIPAGFFDYIAHYLTTWSTVREVFIPGLDVTLGPWWWAILFGGVLGGVAVVLFGDRPLPRLVGAVVVAAFVAYLYTPVNLGFPNLPVYFTPSVRYVMPALTLGFVMLSALPFVRRPMGRRLLVSALVVVFLATQSDWRLLWPKSLRDELTATMLLLVGVAAVVAVARRAWSRPGQIVLALGLVSAVSGTLCFVQRDYLENRWGVGVGSLPAVAELRERRDSRIATDGLVLQYPLYGPDLSNYVQFLGERYGDGSYRPVTTCQAWKRAINRGRYDYVLVTSGNYQLGGAAAEPVAPNQLVWARSDPALREIVRDGIEAAAFEVSGRLDVDACP